MKMRITRLFFDKHHLNTATEFIYSRQKTTDLNSFDATTEPRTEKIVLRVIRPSCDSFHGMHDGMGHGVS